jgi:hypothetical protein
MYVIKGKHGRAGSGEAEGTAGYVDVCRHHTPKSGGNKEAAAYTV